MRRRAVFIIVVTGVISLIAYVSRNWIRDALVLHVAYFLWYLKLLYLAIPQWVTWFLFIGALFILISAKVIADSNFVKGQKENIGRILPGPVEELASIVSKANEGIFFSWLLANRLGLLANEILARRSGTTSRSRFDPLEGTDWNPPAPVQNYLEVGLHGSYADYPRRSWSVVKPEPTPLDLPAGEALAYIESQMEKNNGDHQ